MRSLLTQRNSVFSVTSCSIAALLLEDRSLVLGPWTLVRRVTAYQNRPKNPRKQRAARKWRHMVHRPLQKPLVFPTQFFKTLTVPGVFAMFSYLPRFTATSSCATTTCAGTGTRPFLRHFAAGTKTHDATKTSVHPRRRLTFHKPSRPYTAQPTTRNLKPAH
jgi:hypothetical protein